jgi:hypothetical protein
MSWHADKKQLNGRQMFWVLFGIVGFVFVLVVFEDVGYWYKIGLLALVACFIVRGVLASKSP